MRTERVAPEVAAVCRGVHPFSARASGSAPATRQRDTSFAVAFSKNAVVFQSAHDTCAVAEGATARYRAQNKKPAAIGRYGITVTPGRY